MQSCAKTIATRSFTYVQVWMKHMQQTRSRNWLQQLEAALSKMSVGSVVLISTVTDGLFAAVAARSPKPIPRPPRNKAFSLLDSARFHSFSLLSTCWNVKVCTKCNITYRTLKQIAQLYEVMSLVQMCTSFFRSESGTLFP